ncbi:MULTISPECIES: hypothetical protein [Streptomyces]|nr:MULTISPECIES: hypothetical protein [Streptomyces]
MTCEGPPGLTGLGGPWAPAEAGAGYRLLVRSVADRQAISR